VLRAPLCPASQVLIGKLLATKEIPFSSCLCSNRYAANSLFNAANAVKAPTGAPFAAARGFPSSSLISAENAAMSVIACGSIVAEDVLVLVKAGCSAARAREAPLETVWDWLAIAGGVEEAVDLEVSCGRDRERERPIRENMALNPMSATTESRAQPNARLPPTSATTPTTMSTTSQKMAVFVLLLI
jgi:hypothetical protein